MQASFQSYEKTTNQLGSLLYLVSSQLQVSSSRLSSCHGGEAEIRRSRSREEDQKCTNRRYIHSSNTSEHKKKKENQLKRSQSCTQHDTLRLESMLLDHAHDKVIPKKYVHIQNGQKRRKNTRSKSTAFEFRNVYKSEIVILDPEKSLCNIDHNIKQETLDSKPQPEKALRSKSRKCQLESAEYDSASSEYSKQVTCKYND